jgi:hypothetical protein
MCGGDGQEYWKKKERGRERNDIKTSKIIFSDPRQKYIQHYIYC